MVNFESLPIEAEPSFPTKETMMDLLKETGEARVYEKVCEISKKISEAGGSALLVGGSVRDTFFGKTPKDYDLEVYNIEIDALRSLLASYGEIDEVGKSFGIIKLYIEGKDIDVSIPRKDSKTREGHTGFDVTVDPHLSVAEAAKRRDFTINTLAADPITGKLFDYYGGVKDIQNRILRVTDTVQFKEDPLRVLRAMQFVGRFGLSVDKSSEDCIRQTAAQLHEIAPDRFFEEFEKLLLKSEKPSLGLMAAKDLEIFENFFPHFLRMAETPQDKEWHPEGDVWMHTLMVVDEAAQLIRRYNRTGKEGMVIMLAALLHDVGKPEKTYQSENGYIVSPGHESAGEEKAHAFLKKINASGDIREKVVKLVTNHMMPGSMYRANMGNTPVTDSAIRRLAARLAPATIEELVIVSNADSFGRDIELDRSQYAPGAWLLERARKIGVGETKPQKLISGKDLLPLGFKKGKPLGEMIALGDRIRSLKEELSALEQSPDSVSKEYILDILDGLDSSEKAIAALRRKAFDIIADIRARMESERENK
jgi:tRNA nucleotidyltransferase (CCA-adding enzyme)